MSRRALGHLARSLVEVLAEDEQREQQMQQMQQALMGQMSQMGQQMGQMGVRPMVMGPGPFGFFTQQPAMQFQQPLRAVEEMAATTPKAPSPAAAAAGPAPGHGAAVVEEIGGVRVLVHGVAGGTGHDAATNEGTVRRGPPPVPIVEEPTSPVEPAPSRPAAPERIVAPRYMSETPVGCSPKSAPTAPRVSTTPEAERSSRVSEGTRDRGSSMILFVPNFKLY